MEMDGKEGWRGGIVGEKGALQGGAWGREGDKVGGVNKIVVH